MPAYEVVEGFDLAAFQEAVANCGEGQRSAGLGSSTPGPGCGGESLDL